MRTPRQAIHWAMGVLLLQVSVVGAQADPREKALLEIYATQPRDYPAGPRMAQPDRGVPFRWHGYHPGAIERHDAARMELKGFPYNPLEAGSVTVDKASGIKFAFGAEHRTQGEKAVRLDFPEAAIRAGKAVVGIPGIDGEPSYSSYLQKRGILNTASCFLPHYRWIKFDVFNPGKDDVALRASGVPFRIAPGASTVAVKTTDAVERGYACLLNSLSLEITAPVREVTLFVDHVRVEQEIPPVLSGKGRMFQFAARAEENDPPMLFPGFTAIDTSLYTPERTHGWTLPRKTRGISGHTFRSNENGILWGRAHGIDSPFRVDLPKGKYGVQLLAAPGPGFAWKDGANVLLNGQKHALFPPRSEEEVRRMALGGEAVDYRPGLCVWESLVRPAYYPPTPVLYTEVADGKLLIETAASLSWHALLIFPVEEKDAALQEIGRLNYLMAESWDVSHPWVRPAYAERVRYMGLHEEMQHPAKIAEKVQALKLQASDFDRGFVPFVRSLTEPVFPDTIPTVEETRVKELVGSVARGQTESLTFALLPLTETPGLQVRVSDLSHAEGKASLPAQSLDVRLSRYHQKTLQFGHHNHDYNYAEHYLVHRPRVDLQPGAVRRVYLEVPVPADAKPGKYRGRVEIVSAKNAILASLAISLEVLPITLESPPVFFASSLDEPELKKYGFNAFHTSHDRAAKEGYRAYLANMGHGAPLFQGKPIGWGNAIAQKELLKPLIEAGKEGKAPRGFFGGPAPGTHGNPKAEEIARAFFAEVGQTFPGIDLPGRSFPVFYFRQGKASFQLPHEWIILAGAATADDPKLLEAAAKAGKEFWYIDGIRHSKEQVGRFTYGVWLWRLGAKGRFTTLEAHLQYGGGTAKESYRWQPYFTLLDVTTCNIDRALHESLDGGLNPCRDLLLLRAGIDDYRMLYTLERALARNAAAAAAKEARTFLDELRSELSLDLTQYYEARAGAYGENWYPLPKNPWTHERFQQLRRRAADLIMKLQSE